MLFLFNRSRGPAGRRQWNKGVGTEKASPREGEAILDAAAKRWLNMSGEQFVSKWEAGDFNGDSDRPEVVRVAMLLPFSHR